jgi:hypothetical protein
MPPMRAPRLALALLCLLASGLVLGGCGGGSDQDSTAAALPPAESRPAPAPSGFPSAERRTLRQVLKVADERFEGTVSSAAEVFYPGKNRYPFGVFDPDGGEIVDAEIALYLAKVPMPKPGAESKSGNPGQVAKAEARALDQPARGPFPASIESLAAKPVFRTGGEDADVARVVYSTDLDLPPAGEWKLAAILKQDGELMGTQLPGIVVGRFEKIPKPGERAPVIHTPAPEGQNKVDYAAALGKEPIVLLFATPEFCQSRVCGPVVDVAAQAQHEYGDEAAFIHMQIYNDNDPAQGVRPQVRKFHLPTEPFLFTIDRSGVVADAVEGAFGLELMHEAVDKAIAR